MQSDEHDDETTVESLREHDASAGPSASRDGESHLDPPDALWHGRISPIPAVSMLPGTLPRTRDCAGSCKTYRGKADSLLFQAVRTNLQIERIHQTAAQQALVRSEPVEAGRSETTRRTLVLRELGCSSGFDSERNMNHGGDAHHNAERRSSSRCVQSDDHDDESHYGGHRNAQLGCDRGDVARMQELRTGGMCMPQGSTIV